MRPEGAIMPARKSSSPCASGGGQGGGRRQQNAPRRQSPPLSSPSKQGDIAIAGLVDSQKKELRSPMARLRKIQLSSTNLSGSEKDARILFAVNEDLW